VLEEQKVDEARNVVRGHSASRPALDPDVERIRPGDGSDHDLT
jgi:hypothetical protein